MRCVSPLSPGCGPVRPLSSGLKLANCSRSAPLTASYNILFMQPFFLVDIVDKIGEKCRHCEAWRTGEKRLASQLGQLIMAVGFLDHVGRGSKSTERRDLERGVPRSRLLMDFSTEISLPAPAALVWKVLTDFHLAAACVPGCENVEEIVPLGHYRAVIRRRVGLFKIEVPIDIVVEVIEGGLSLLARASGRDGITGTFVATKLSLDLRAIADHESCLAVQTSVQVSGRLASLGFPLIRKQTEDTFNEFRERLRRTLISHGSAATT